MFWRSMWRVVCFSVFVGAQAAPALFAGGSANAHEIIVTIHCVKALDRIDQTPADFFARVTIDGNEQKTPKERQKNDTCPEWEVRQEVRPGRRDIKIELWDKDLALDDLIDINGRGDISKRHQDLGVNTRSCRVYGFRGRPRCGTKITRSGDEKKRAQITFSVKVQR